MGIRDQDDAEKVKHTLFEDIQGIAFGVFSCALGFVFLTHLGLITGQTAGLALIISYVSGYNFGLVFFLVNIPFYWFTYHSLGLAFTIKSAICVACMSLLVEVMPHMIVFEHLDPFFGTLAFGAITGIGLLAIIRHDGSMGGAGALALTIQELTSFKAGYVQQMFDVLIFGSALFLFPLEKVAFSLLGSIILNFIIAVNHRRDHYVAR
ncbi:Uncharacterised 5xTM membrane BCR, YitT family COG1284 [Cohaesibacter sp. ES.047]|uniref:YitT family protein n=1 Tax=Cohaesibacter sp. ES.047 TaxID=1798205 RepID=UPI000BB93162|nr:YitT family protein [Cohaesibacter sp. ES.047]SNY92469.1 Uncharacterised 5xTM membrane BCR, YitT family COG1284 [Cohaesibacter sp. ES.047]